MRFAVALVANPDLLVLDEPTAALDVESRHEFWTAMRAVAAEGKTVVFATHYLEEADAYRRPHRPHGARPGCRRRPPDRDKGQGRQPDDPGHSARGAIHRRCRLCPVSAAPTPGVRRSCSACARFRPRHCGSCSSAIPHAQDIEVRGAGLEEAFLELTADDDDETQ